MKLAPEQIKECEHLGLEWIANTSKFNILECWTAGYCTAMEKMQREIYSLNHCYRLLEDARHKQHSRADELTAKNAHLQQNYCEAKDDVKVLTEKLLAAKEAFNQTMEALREEATKCGMLDVVILELAEELKATESERDKLLKTHIPTIPSYPYVALTDFEAESAKVLKLREALEKIAHEDFRGNWPNSVIIAYNALKSISD